MANIGRQSGKNLFQLIYLHITPDHATLSEAEASFYGATLPCFAGLLKKILRSGLAQNDKVR